MERFNRQDYRYIIICLLLLVISIWFSRQNFSRAYPEASIDFKITGDGAKRIATSFLEKVSLVPDDYYKVTVFDYDNQTKVYLERTLGLEKANELFDDEVKLWKWSTRWFKPLTKEEFTVDITPTGTLMGYRHLIEEDRAASLLEVDAARDRAEAFINKYTSLDFNDLSDPQIKTEKRPNRIDYTFTWERKNLQIGDAVYEYKIDVAGDFVSGYAEGLRVPEDWIRDYTRLRSLNETTGFVNLLFMLLTFLGLLVMFIRKIMSRDIQWGVASAFGFAAFFLYFVGQVNAIPLQLFEYVTTESFMAFLSRTFLQSFIYSLTIGSVIFIIVATAESLYRKDFPQAIAIRHLLSWQSIRSKKFFKDVLLGYTLTGLFLAYQIIYYLIAEHFGAWSPADIPYSNILNTALPWAAIILSGFLPAVGEEFFNRVFSISFFHKLFRFRFLAVVVAAFIWGFGHSTYPNQPFFIRGLEVGLAGVVLGIVYLRSGILPLLVWHYTINAMLSTVVFFRSSSIYFIIMAIFITGIMLIPFIISLFSYIKSRGFVVSSAIRQETIPPPRKVKTEVPVFEAFTNLEYRPLKNKTIITAMIFIIILFIILFATPDREHIVSQDFRVSPSLVQDRADYFLNNQGGKVTSFRSVVYITPNFVRREQEDLVEREDLPRFQDARDRLAIRYIFQTGGFKALNKVLLKIPHSVWAVRYFIPEQKDEWTIYVNPADGRPFRFVHLLPKDDPGARLTDGEALTRAVSFLKHEDISLRMYDLKGREVKKRKDRYDYQFVWEKVSPLAGEARERLFMILRGDKIGEYKHYVKIPEQWERQRMEQKIHDNIRSALQFIIEICFSLAGLWILYSSLRKGRVRLNIALKWAIVPTALVLINTINTYPIAYAAYPTAIAESTFLISTFTGILIKTLLHYVLFTFFLAIIDALFPLQEVLRQLNRGIKSRDALITLLVSALSAGLIKKAIHLLHTEFPSISPLPPIQDVAGLALPIPLFNPLESIVFWSMLGLCLLAIGAWIFKTFIRSTNVLFLVGIVLTLFFIPQQQHTRSEMVLGFFQTGLIIFPALLLIVTFFRNNILAYILVVILLPVLHAGHGLLHLPNSFFKANGIMLLIFGIILILPTMKAALHHYNRARSNTENQEV